MSDPSNTGPVGPTHIDETQQQDKHDESHEKINSQIDNLIDVLSNEFERLSIKQAVCIIRDPQSNKPKVYLHGHPYDTAVLLRNVSKDISEELMRQLN
jgi:hypothetical protein